MLPPRGEIRRQGLQIINQSVRDHENEGGGITFESLFDDLLCDVCIAVRGTGGAADMKRAKVLHEVILDGASQIGCHDDDER